MKVIAENIPEKILGQKPVDYWLVPEGILEAFDTALEEAETSRTEKPMQCFFEMHQVALLCLLRPHQAWVFPRQALNKPSGGGWEPDFLICDWNSNGPKWTIVELESPTKKATNTQGVSGDLRHAQQQIEDYRRHMRDHWQALHSDGLPGTQTQGQSVIVIGRREHRTIQDQGRLNELNNNDVEVMSYDRLRGHLADMVNYRNAEIAKLKQVLAKVRDVPPEAADQL